MANDFIKVDYDKFENKRTTTMNYPYLFWAPAGPWEQGNSLEVRNTVSQGIDHMCAQLRHISTPDVDSLLIDIISMREGWFFLRDGMFTININNVENIRLEPHDSYAKTGSNPFGMSRCKESCFYRINQDILKKICDADSLDFKVAGKNTSIEVNANEFIIYARRFYNGLYDENAYLDSLNEAEEKAKSNKGCVVTLLMALSAITSLAACLLFLVGVF